MIRLVFRACPNTCLVITLRSAAASPSCEDVLMQRGVTLYSVNKHRPHLRKFGEMRFNSETLCSFMKNGITVYCGITIKEVMFFVFS